MGTWSIEPTGKTASITQEGVVNVGPNTGASINYTVYYKDSGYCGKYEFKQEGTTPPEPQGNESYINLKFTNRLNKDVYVTGHEIIGISNPHPELISKYGTYAKITIKLKNPVEGCACVKVPAKNGDVDGSITIPYTDVVFTIPGAVDEGETLAMYDGGQVIKFDSGEPYYWRAYSWTSAEDPAVIKLDKSAAALPTVFHTGTTTNPETLEFIIIETDEDHEGRINGCTTPCY